MKRNLICISVAVLLSSLSAVLVSKYYISKSPYIFQQGETVYKNVELQGGYPDFTYAAESSVNGVVHVKVLRREKAPEQANILQHFFGYGFPQQLPRESVNSGSGVIITPDGYIVTNNHVVEGAAEIMVTLNNNKSFNASVVGTDPVTDIALLKVEGENLPVIPLGSSEDLRLGEWVLAIGSPFNLKSTITAGIVSAKGRSLPDMSGEFKIESFIQTDAAVNPGNSGGALVNTKGELVGINTAIASNTGSYTGYSFAVPTAIMQKVVEDIKEFGKVKRAILGITMQELTDDLAKQCGMKGDFFGVYVYKAQRGGAADLSGIKEGDIIISIDSNVVMNPSDIQEKINSYRPGDTIGVAIFRDGKRVDLDVVLQGDGSEVAKSTGESKELLGALLQSAPEKMLKRLGISHGVQVVEIGKGKMRSAGVKKDFIITHINQVPVTSADDIVQIVGKARRSVLIEGLYPNGQVYYYGMGV